MSDAWFKAKTPGARASPANWQGWLTASLLAGSAAAFAAYWLADPRSLTVKSWLIFGGVMLALRGLYDMIVIAKSDGR